jgi:hypothetical protein
MLIRSLSRCRSSSGPPPVAALTRMRVGGAGHGGCPVPSAPHHMDGPGPSTLAAFYEEPAVSAG